MTKRIKILLRIGVLAAPVIACAAVILRAVALLMDFEIDREYFSKDSLLPTALSGVLLGTLVLFVLIALFLRRPLRHEPAPRSLFLFFTEVLLAIALFVAFVYGLFSLSDLSEPFLRVFTALTAFCAVASAVYFLLVLYGAAGRLTVLLSFAPVFYGLFAAMALYFDKTTQINHPAKALSLAALAFLSLYFLSACRAVLERRKPALHFCISSVALVMSATASIPALLYTMANNIPSLLSVVDDFAMFAFALYILAQHLRQLPHKEPARHALVESMMAAEAAPIAVDPTEAADESDGADAENAEDAADEAGEQDGEKA